MNADTFSIRDLALSPLQKDEQFTHALQSYPFLVKDGRLAITADSGLRGRRTAVGVDGEHNTYIIVADTFEPTLYEFMRLIHEMEIPFAYVLNLDGGPSTGVYSSWKGQELKIDSYTRVSSIIRFSK